MSSITVRIGSDESGLSGGLKRAETLVKSFAENTKSSLSSIGAGFGVGGGFVGLQSLGQTIKSAVQQAANIQALTTALRTVTKDAGSLESQLSQLRSMGELPGLTFEGALKGSVRLQAVGFSADKAMKILREFGNANATIGGGKAEMDGIVLALGQIAAKGKVSAEEINQLAERMPQIRLMMKQAFGTADTESLQKMGVSAERFINGIVEQLANAPRVDGGLNTQLKNLEESWKRLLETAGKPIAAGLAPALAKLADEAKTLGPAFESMGKHLGTVANAAVFLIPKVGNLGTLFAGYKMASFVAGLTSSAAAMRTAATAANVETAALTANSAAISRNANERERLRRAALLAPALSSSITSSVPFSMQALRTVGADVAAKRAAQTFAGSFATFAGSEIAARGPAIVAGLAIGSSFLDTGKALGGETGKGVVDGLSIFASAMGPQGLAVAIGMQLAQAGYILGQEMGGQIIEGMYAGVEAEQRKGVGEVMKILQEGKEGAAKLRAEGKHGEADRFYKSKDSEARATLADQIAAQQKAMSGIGNTESDEYEAAQLTLQLLLAQRKAMDDMAASAGERAREEQANAAALKAQATALENEAWDKQANRRKLGAQAERDQAEGKAGERLPKEMNQAREAVIAFASPDKQIDFWVKEVQRRLEQAKAEFNLGEYLKGRPQMSGTATPEDLMGKAGELKSQGRHQEALKLLDAIQEAVKAQEKLNQLQEQKTAKTKQDNEKSQSEKDKADKLAKSREEWQLEQDLLKAKAIAGDRDSEGVRVLEDKLSALRMQQAYMQQFGVDAGVALNLANQRVAAERSVEASLKNQQQVAALKGLQSQAAINHARAHGHNRKADRMESQAGEEAKVKELMDKGVPEAEARKQAQEMQRDEDKLAGKPGVIKSKKSPGFQGLNGPRTPTLDAYNAQGKDNLKAKTPALDAMKAQAKADAAAKGGGVVPQAAQQAQQIVDKAQGGDPTLSVLERMLEVFESFDRKFDLA